MKRLILAILILLSSAANAYRLNEGAIALDEKVQKTLVTTIDNDFDSSQKVFASTFNSQVVLYGFVTNERYKSEAEKLVNDKIKNQPLQIFHLRPAINLIKVSELASKMKIDQKLDKQIYDDIYRNLPDTLVRYAIKVTVFDGSVYLQGIVTKSEGDLIAKVASQAPNVKGVYKVFGIVSDSDAARLDNFGIK